MPESQQFLDEMMSQCERGVSDQKRQTPVVTTAYSLIIEALVINFSHILKATRQQMLDQDLWSLIEANNRLSLVNAAGYCYYFNSEIKVSDRAFAAAS